MIDLLDIAGYRFDRFRTCLEDEYLTAVTIFRPLNVHGTAVVFLDGNGMMGQLQYLLIIDGKLPALIGFNLDIMCRYPGYRISGVDHLDRLLPQLAF